VEKLILVDINIDLCNAWEKAFANFEEVVVVNDSFQHIKEFDCMVSPANSFGLMDGGIDAAIINFFGKELEYAVQDYIIDNYQGEQPVGTSFIIETLDEFHPYLAHTPTMRIPSMISHTENVYYAMKAMLSAVRNFNIIDPKIRTVLCPGLGTATGRVQPEMAAQQMLLAYKSFKRKPEKINWLYARKRDDEIKQSILS
jgi:O-acetyl-ADP-ribose deacetylase (regulator of RNase III)